MCGVPSSVGVSLSCWKWGDGSQRLGSPQQMSGSRLGRKAWAPSLIHKFVIMDVAAWFTDDFF